MKKNNENILMMKDLYFSKFSYENLRDMEASQIDVRHDIKYMSKKENENIIKVIVNTNIKNKKETIKLELETVGEFEINPADLDSVTKKFIMTKNTLAIMFPFIRSEISILTTQPGVMPILLQPINLNSLTEADIKICEEN